MRVDRGTIDGPVEVIDELEMFGIIAGDTTVRPGGRLVLRGMCSGNVVVEAAARADIYGTVSGNVTNQGGVLFVHGVINGLLITTAGKTSVAPMAILGGQNS